MDELYFEVNIKYKYEYYKSNTQKGIQVACFEVCNRWGRYN